MGGVASLHDEVVVDLLRREVNIGKLSLRVLK